jgi:putative endonuclease
MPSYVYILASKTAGTLYTGVTSDLIKRVSEHKDGTIRGFTSRYKVTRLVWYEVHDDIEFAIRREKQIKEWQRAWKIQLIEKGNPDWRDLFNKIMGIRGQFRASG